jgi:hypothetical protein
VLFWAGSFVGFIDYGTHGTPKISTVEAIVSKAVVKVTGSSATAPGTTAPTSAAPTTTSPASEPATAGQHYLSVLTPIYSTAKQFGATLIGDGTTVTVAQRVQQATPFVKALHTAESGLTDYTWPGVAQADVKTLAADFDTVVAGLGSLATNTSDLAAREAALKYDLTAALSADAAVRRDLGLPPAPGLTT